MQNKLEKAQMLVMPDIEDPFVPLGSDGLFVDPYDSKSVSSPPSILCNLLIFQIGHHIPTRTIAEFFRRN